MGEAPSTFEREETTNNAPILQLRPDSCITDADRSLWKRPDGPWLRWPDEIKEEKCTLESAAYPLDIGIDEYRVYRKAHFERLKKELQAVKPSERHTLFKVSHVFSIPPVVNMKVKSNTSDEEKEELIERHIVHCDIYLLPGTRPALGTIEKFRADWASNARGIYYRHYFSIDWVTADHTVWIPTLVDRDWDHPEEHDRRERARKLLGHSLDNERFNKSEYAWEADAWNDVFGQMRDDPALAADKREYYKHIADVYPVSHTLTGTSKFCKRIPDATFGLATFLPKHYQNAIASYDLDAERLQALMLHRDCGLISDPKCGETDLVFPFAVYEAKGWSGDPREARIQACTAGTAYLDMLDNLARVPGSAEAAYSAYQFDDSRSSQVFAIISFGSYWHIMVGYRRPRLKREHAGHPGMSENVYVFQRIWSGRIMNERKAWLLLCLIDQIHDWGVTTHRDYVIRHLKAWHEYCFKSWAEDARVWRHLAGKNLDHLETNIVQFLPPAWVNDFNEDFQAAIQEKSDIALTKAAREERPGEPFVRCCVNQCRDLQTPGGPGYALYSPEDASRHLLKVHKSEPTEESRSYIQEEFRQSSLAMEEEYGRAPLSGGKRRRQDDDDGEDDDDNEEHGERLAKRTQRCAEASAQGM